MSSAMRYIVAVGEIIKNITALKIRIEGTDIFWDDEATDGHTLFGKYNLIKNFSFCKRKLLNHSIHSYPPAQNQHL